MAYGGDMNDRGEGDVIIKNISTESRVLVVGRARKTVRVRKVDSGKPDDTDGDVW